MHYCDKCGEKLVDVSLPCPTCGLKIDNSDNHIIINNKSYFSIFVVIVVLLFGGGLFFIQNNFSSVMINYDAYNYSLSYDNILWTEYEIGEDVYALVNNKDKDIYLQFPVEAEELGFTLENDEKCKAVYDAYVLSLKNSTNMIYSNISSNINILEGTNYYYLTADYSRYNGDSSGRLYVILTEEGKAINILLTKGNSNVDIEKDILDILRSIEM